MRQTIKQFIVNAKGTLVRMRSPDYAVSCIRQAWRFPWHLIAGDEFSRFYRYVFRYTSIPPLRLRELYRAIRHAVREGIPGDVVECGTARGGSAALMGLTVRQYGDGRRLWLFDTFEGLPEPTAVDSGMEDARKYTGACRGELQEVAALLDRAGVLARSRLVKGLFQDTLPASDLGAIAVLHIDCDWYESVRSCLEHLYDRVTPGGVIQFDDYGHWPGADRAVDEFLARPGVNAQVRDLGYFGRQIVKRSGEPL